MGIEGVAREKAGSTETETETETETNGGVEKLGHGTVRNGRRGRRGGGRLCGDNAKPWSLGRDLERVSEQASINVLFALVDFFQRVSSTSVLC